MPTSSSRPKGARRVGEGAVAYGADAYVDMVRVRLEGLVDLLGSNRTASFLGVNKSQPSRWRSGQEGIGSDRAQRVLDLDYVIARLLGQMDPNAIDNWMLGANPWLGGARPIDVLQRRGALAILAAVEAEEQGAYL